MSQIGLILLLISSVTCCCTLTSQTLFWCENDSNGSRIVGRQLLETHGGSPGSVFLHESESTEIGPRSLAVDNLNQKIYWVNLAERTLSRSDLDGTATEVLISDNYDPYDVVLAPSLNKMFWTDLGGYLIQSNYDGTGVEIILEDGLYFRTSLSFHNELAILFWQEGNAIKKLDISSGDIQTVIPDNGNSINDHVIDELNNKIIWTDETAGTLNRANLDGSDIEVLHNGIDEGKKPFSVAVNPGAYTMYWSESDSINSTIWSGDIWGSSALRLADLMGGKHYGIEISAVDVINDVEDTNRVDAFTIYPNPAGDLVTIDIAGSILGDDLSIDVTDVQGRPLVSRPLRDNSTQLNLTNLNYGNYFAVLRINGKAIAIENFVKL